MLSDYSQFWQPLNHDGQAPDVHFYDFFEDSLNQFISTNSGSQQPAGERSLGEPLKEVNNKSSTFTAE